MASRKKPTTTGGGKGGGGSPLADYDPLLDPNLRHFFSNAPVQKQLLTAGLIDSEGRILNRKAVASKNGVQSAQAKAASKEQEVLAREEAELRRRVREMRLAKLMEEQNARRLALFKEEERIRNEIVKLMKESSAGAVAAAGKPGAFTTPVGASTSSLRSGSAAVSPEPSLALSGSPPDATAGYSSYLRMGSLSAAGGSSSAGQAQRGDGNDSDDSSEGFTPRGGRGGGSKGSSPGLGHGLRHSTEKPKGPGGAEIDDSEVHELLNFSGPGGTTSINTRLGGTGSVAAGGSVILGGSVVLSDLPPQDDAAAALALLTRAATASSGVRKPGTAPGQGAGSGGASGTVAAAASSSSSPPRPDTSTGEGRKVSTPDMFAKRPPSQQQQGEAAS